MKKVSIIIFLIICLVYPVRSRGQESVQLPSKLQLAVEPEEIVLTKGITVGTSERNIPIIVRETSGINNAKLELVAHPFTNVNTGDIVDANIVTVDISTPQASLAPGGLQQVKLTIGGFEQAGSYLGGITIHDTVSGEQKKVLMPDLVANLDICTI